MLDNIKSRLLHFETDGDIIPDFVASRLKKSEKLRNIVRVCFYLQSLFALGCIAVGIALGGSVLNAVFAVLAGILVIAVALFALGGGSAEKTISYIMDLIYAVVCFVLGGTGMYICGGLMIGAALTALVSFFADYLRRWLLEYSPLYIREEHYALTEKGRKRQEQEQTELNITPPEPEKTELQSVAEAFAELMK